MRLVAPGLECEIALSEPDREGWMSTDVQVKTLAFEGSFVCSLIVDEWDALISTLQSLEAVFDEDASASWANMEQNIELDFELHSSGFLECTYAFSPKVVDLGPTLSGLFEADRSYLHDWIVSARDERGGAR